MVFIGILFIGGLAGLILAKVTLFFTNGTLAEKYPVGGFAPAMLIVFDLGTDNSLLAACLLSMGGLAGYYLGVTIWNRYLLKGATKHVVKKQDIESNVSMGDYLK